MTGLFFRRLDEDDQYARIKLNGKELVHGGLGAPQNWTEAGFNHYSKKVPIFVRQAKLLGHQHIEERSFGFRLGDGLLENNAKTEKKLRVVGSPKRLLWKEAKRTLILQYGFPYLDVLAYLDISKQGKKFGEIKLCFDFDSNLIVLVTKIYATGAKDPTLLTYSTGDDVYSEQERQRWPSFAERLPYNTHPQAWNTVNNQSVASKNSIRSGLWQFPGNRIEGLGVFLGNTEIRVPMKKITRSLAENVGSSVLRTCQGVAQKAFRLSNCYIDWFWEVMINCGCSTALPGIKNI